ncbi:MAG: four-carbon acid sugar kinase family protein [Opitutales bacterium]
MGLPRPSEAWARPDGSTLVLADDVTGAAETAALLALAGHPADLRLTPARGHTSGPVVLATLTRSLDPARVDERLEPLLAGSHRDGSPPLYLKMDSTLKGNPWADSRAVARRFGFAVALFAPAYPAQGRTLHGGRLHLRDRPTDAHLPDRLRAQGAPTVIQAPVADSAVVGRVLAEAAQAPAGEPVCLVIDRPEAEHLLPALDRLAAAGYPALPVGSAGCFRALLGLPDEPAEQPRATEPPACPRVLLLTGSEQPTTREQVAHWQERRGALIRTAGEAEPEELAQAWARGRPVGIQLPVYRDAARARATVARLRPCLTGEKNTLLVCTGGDTAALVLDCLGAEAVRIEGECLPGLPWGRIRDGGGGRLFWLSKAGGFGEPDALTRAIDRFRDPGAHSGSPEETTFSS